MDMDRHFDCYFCTAAAAAAAAAAAVVVVVVVVVVVHVIFLSGLCIFSVLLGRYLGEEPLAFS
jgi:hypothetical protein